MGKKKYTVYVTTTIHEKLKHVAGLLGISVEDYVHDLIANSN